MHTHTMYVHKWVAYNTINIHNVFGVLIAVMDIVSQYDCFMPISRIRPLGITLK